MDVMAVPIWLVSVVIMPVMVMRMTLARRMEMRGMAVTGNYGDGLRHCCNNITLPEIIPVPRRGI